jgi:hypothetical protein
MIRGIAGAAQPVAALYQREAVPDGQGLPGVIRKIHEKA